MDGARALSRSGRPERLTYVRRHNTWQIQFIALAATWGASFLFIKVLDRHWPVLWVSLGRVALGAAALLVPVLARGERLPTEPRVWLHCAGAAVLFNAVPWTLFAYGEHHASSIVAGLWNATTPLWVLIVSLAAFGEQQPTGERVAGLVIGFAGVATLLGPWRGFGGGQLAGHLACAGAALCYGIGFPYTRRHLTDRPESGVVLSAAQTAFAGVGTSPSKHRAGFGSSPGLLLPATRHHRFAA